MFQVKREFGFGVALAAWLVSVGAASGAPAWLADEQGGLFINEKATGIVKRVVPSFTYGGKPFDAAAWKCERAEAGIADRAKVVELAFLSPDRKLRFRLETRVYQDFPVTELRPVLETAGGGPTELIEDFQTLSLKAQSLVRQVGRQPWWRRPDVRSVRIRAVTGGKSDYADFARHDRILSGLHGCEAFTIDTLEGRSSGDWLPYFGVDFTGGEGLEVAIGWSGNWKADFAFERKQYSFTMSAGFKNARFKMYPGERFSLPSILVYSRHDESIREGAVKFRRFLMAHKAPRDAEGKLYPNHLPLTTNGGGLETAKILKLIEWKVAHPEFGFNVVWMDAGWNGPARKLKGPYEDWTKYLGDWRVNAAVHPGGTLRPIADAAHAAGMKFLLWFEAECAATNAPVFKEHPGYFFPEPVSQWGSQRYLLNLGDPAAWKWIYETVSDVIAKNGVDIYRVDFNMDPGPAWASSDTTNRVGVSEIKYVNGLWAFWDALRARFNSMLIENCASGGRRLDFELMARSHSYCRDDSHMIPQSEALCQNITLDSTAYVPFTGGETCFVPALDDYSFLSHAAGTTVVTPDAWNFFDGKDHAKETAWLGRMMELARRIQPSFAGDFYALTDYGWSDTEGWCAYQLDDPAKKAGFFIAFRREKCREPELALKLGGIDSAKTYELEIYGQGKKTMKGAAFAHYLVTLPEPRSFLLVFYR